VSEDKAWFVTLSDTERALLKSVDLSPSTHTRKEIETWLIENGYEELRQMAAEATPPPLAAPDAAAATMGAAGAGSPLARVGTASVAPKPSVSTAPPEPEAHKSLAKGLAHPPKMGFFGGGRPDCIHAK